MVKNKRFQLEYGGELPFGPPYFSLIINGKKVHDRSFFDNFLLNSSGEILLIPEYHYLRRDEGFKVLLIQFNLKNGNEKVVSSINNGFIISRQLEGNKLIYVKEPIGHVSREFEIDLILN